MLAAAVTKDSAFAAAVELVAVEPVVAGAIAQTDSHLIEL